MKLLATVVRSRNSPSAKDTTTPLQFKVIITIEVSAAQTAWLRNKKNALKLPDVRGHRISIDSAGNLRLTISREGFMFVRIANPFELASYGKKVFEEAEKVLTTQAP